MSPRLLTLALLLLPTTVAADLYKSLGVSRDCDDRCLKKAYRRMALQHHPDKQADKSEDERKAASDQFLAASQAFEVLSDPEKRKLYDTYGESALKPQSSTGGGGFRGGGGFGGFGFRDPLEVFEALFGSGFGSGSTVYMDASGRRFVHQSGGGGWQQQQQRAQYAQYGQRHPEQFAQYEQRLRQAHAQNQQQRDQYLQYAQRQREQYAQYEQRQRQAHAQFVAQQHARAHAERQAASERQARQAEFDAEARAHTEAQYARRRAAHESMDGARSKLSRSKLGQI